MAASALEMEDAQHILDLLETTVDIPIGTRSSGWPTRSLEPGLRSGSVGNLASARRVVELVDQVHDPFARCSFRCDYKATHSIWVRSTKTLKNKRCWYWRTLPTSALIRLFPTRTTSLRSPSPDSIGIQTLIASWTTRFVSHGDAATTRPTKRLRRANANTRPGGRAAEACAIEPPDLSGSLRSMRGRGPRVARTGARHARTPR